MIPTEGHLVISIELVVVPGGHEDVHRVSDHGDVDSLVVVSHPLADHLVIKPVIGCNTVKVSLY